MNEEAVPFCVVPDIVDRFGWIEFRLHRDQTRRLDVVMHGVRHLKLSFEGVMAVHHEDELTGSGSLPDVLPKITTQLWTYPLLIIRNSTWTTRWEGIYDSRAHFALISECDLVQVIALPDVVASWIEL